MKKSNVFYKAWAIKKQNPTFTFRKALVLAWNVCKFSENMKGGNIVEFVYIKLDGSIRIAKGTLPEVVDQFKAANKTVGQNSVINYFDIEKEGWRSFKATNFIKAF